MSSSAGYLAFLCGARHGWLWEGCRPFRGLLVAALAERQPTAGLGASRRRGPLVASQALNVTAHSCTQAHRDAGPAPRSHARSQGRLAGDGDRIGDGGADLEAIEPHRALSSAVGPSLSTPPGAWARACPYVLGRPDSFHAVLVTVKLFAGPLSGQGGERTVRPRHGPGPSDPAMSKSADPRGDPEETPRRSRWGWSARRAGRAPPARRAGAGPLQLPRPRRPVRRGPRRVLLPSRG